MLRMLVATLVPFRYTAEPYLVHKPASV